MLGDSCIMAYTKQYPADLCGIDEEEGRLVIQEASGRRAVYEPDGETSEAFMSRLTRSREEHRNLFFDEWSRCLTMEERMSDTQVHGLARTCIDAYRDQYPEDEIRPALPGRPAAIYWTDPRYPGGMFISVEPPGETNAAFIRRLERSRTEGRNLFHEEWVLDR